MALLGENGLAKDLGFPILSLSLFFFFFYSPVPDKDQQSGCSIFSEDITGGGGREEPAILLPGPVSCKEGWL